MLQTDKGIAPGLPVFMSEPLKALVDQAKAQKALDNNEVCGLFLFHASEWLPGTGWIGDIVYKAVPNLAATVGGSSAFEMDPVSAAIFMSDAVDARDNAATAAVARYGYVSWADAVRDDTLTQIEVMRRDGIVVDSVRAQEHVDRALYEEMMDLSQGFSNHVVKQGYISIPPTNDDGSFVKDEVARMSAHTWLMCRGVAVLCGIGHSHPGGNATLSPQDFLATNVVDQWRDTFAVWYPTEGQNAGSSLELVRGVGSWIYALSQDSDSTVVRYDKRGVRGSWTGPF